MMGGRVTPIGKEGQPLVVSSVESCTRPAGGLLQAYAERPGGFTDCYSVTVDAPVSLTDFVAAFYATPLFRLERLILKVAAGIASDDSDARGLGDGSSDKFSAWTVEARASDQLLMCPLDGRTRSWFMVVRFAAGTRLYFGSAIVPAMNARARSRAGGWVYALLLWLHDKYSRALLSAAGRRLRGVR